jgi:hypothetical protein
MKNEEDDFRINIENNKFQEEKKAWVRLYRQVMYTTTGITCLLLSWHITSMVTFTINGRQTEYSMLSKEEQQFRFTLMVGVLTIFQTLFVILVFEAISFALFNN